MGSRAHRRQGGIIDAHHGEVRVESADHTVTTFILHLPWSKDALGLKKLSLTFDAFTQQHTHQSDDPGRLLGRAEKTEATPPHSLVKTGEPP
jgi:hypothetical protein